MVLAKNMKMPTFVGWQLPSGIHMRDSFTSMHIGIAGVDRVVSHPA